MATTKVGSRTGIKLTKKNRVAILARAREIISDKKRWTTKKLRRKRGDQYQYCLLGACEQAAYDLGIIEPTGKAFREQIKGTLTKPAEEGLGYRLGMDLSLYEYSKETRQAAPFRVNDDYGHEAAVKLLDDYLAEVKKGKARDMNPSD